MTPKQSINRVASSALALTLFLFGLIILGCGAAAIAYLFDYTAGLMQKIFQIFFGIIFLGGGGFISIRSLAWFFKILKS